MRFALLTSLLLSGLASVQGLTSTLQKVTNFGSNPTNVGMFVYKPTTVAAKPALIVAIHYCTGTAQAYFTGSPYAQLADQFGFIVIYPSSPWSGTCWDVSSKATLTHNGGGDSNAIANMVTFAIANFNVDSTRVFVTGSSSGAMMTNVMCATYPNLFKAATVYSGVPAGCFFSNFGGTDAWNSTCAQGQSITTQAAWGAVARNMFPGYTGTYPAIQEYHGTADTTLFPQNLIEEEKQWAGVFGYNQSAPQQVLTNNPSSGYTKSIFGPSLQGIIGQGVGHTVPIMGNEDMKWFGIVSGGAGTPSGPTTTVVGTKPPTTTVSTTAPTQPTGGVAQHFDQCDGQGFTPKTCVSPFTCTAVSPPWYYQCL